MVFPSILNSLFLPPNFDRPQNTEFRNSLEIINWIVKHENIHSEVGSCRVVETGKFTIISHS